MTMNPIPSATVSKVEGCWDLAPRYRIILKRNDRGMTVSQRTTDKLGSPVARTDDVHYDPNGDTLSFEGIGNIHRVLVRLRVSKATVESAFSTETSPGKWIHGTWEPASRCTSTSLDEP
jgi:hypothetical protein